jgi:hypothetical protein
LAVSISLITFWSIAILRPVNASLLVETILLIPLPGTVSSVASSAIAQDLRAARSYCSSVISISKSLLP